MDPNHALAQASGLISERVLLSLPRVAWLERQPDYKPWPPLLLPAPR